MTIRINPTPEERAAWYREKSRRRSVAAYRNSLPTGITKLTAMLDDTTLPEWQRVVIQDRIETVRTTNRLKNRRRRAAIRRAEEAARNA